MKLNRETFLQSLMSVSAGLTPKEKLEQSSCFAFDQGEVITFNGEISCRSPSGLDSAFRGVAKAESFTNALGKMSGEVIDVTWTDSQLVVKNKYREKLKINLKAEILMPLEALEKPGKWSKLPDDFLDAVNVVAPCASSNQLDEMAPYIHLTAKYMEATDSVQFARYQMKLGLDSSTLVKAKTLKEVVPLGVTEFSLSANWFHFKNPADLIVSVRRYSGEYRDLGHALELVDARPAVLPRTISKAAALAGDFAEEDANNESRVQISIRPDSMRIVGHGISGEFGKILDVQYDGPRLDFLISPRILGELIKKHDQCELNNDRLLINGGRWKYVTSLFHLSNGEDNGHVKE